MNDKQAVTIPLSHLTAEERFQARGDGLSEAHVRLLMESDPQDWPPVLVAPNGDGTYGLRDGFHRVETARRLGVPALRCRVMEGAGYPEAVTANIAHGLSLSRDDRKDAARWWAETDPGMSYREIGRRTGLSDKTVKAALMEGERPERSRPAPDPVARFVSQILRVDDEGTMSSKKLRKEIESYNDESRADVAEAIATVGRELLEAAAPYLQGR